MSMMGSAGRDGGQNAMFRLEYPQSIGVYSTYADAKQAIDALAAQEFPISNLEIVGTDLKLVERVTGRKTWWTVIQQGMFSGLSTALMIAMILFLLDPERDFVGLLLEALAIGLVIGVGFAVVGQAFARGRRDYTSISQTIPSKFELLCAHTVAMQARELLARTPAGRAAAFNPQQPPLGSAASGYPNQPYPGAGYSTSAYPASQPPGSTPAAGVGSPGPAAYPPPTAPAPYGAPSSSGVADGSNPPAPNETDGGQSGASASGPSSPATPQRRDQFDPRPGRSPEAPRD